MPPNLLSHGACVIHTAKVCSLQGMHEVERDRVCMYGFRRERARKPDEHDESFSLYCTLLILSIRTQRSEGTCVPRGELVSLACMHFLL